MVPSRSDGTPFMGTTDSGCVARPCDFASQSSSLRSSGSLTPLAQANPATQQEAPLCAAKAALLHGPQMGYSADAVAFDRIQPYCSLDYDGDRPLSPRQRRIDMMASGILLAAMAATHIASVEGDEWKSSPLRYETMSGAASERSGGSEAATPLPLQRSSCLPRTAERRARDRFRGARGARRSTNSTSTRCGC